MATLRRHGTFISKNESGRAERDGSHRYPIDSWAANRRCRHAALLRIARASHQVSPMSLKEPRRRFILGACGTLFKTLTEETLRHLLGS